MIGGWGLLLGRDGELDRLDELIARVRSGCGAVAMAGQKVIVKHLDAIENFGSIEVL